MKNVTYLWKSEIGITQHQKICFDSEQFATDETCEFIRAVLGGTLTKAGGADFDAVPIERVISPERLFVRGEVPAKVAEKLTDNILNGLQKLWEASDSSALQSSFIRKIRNSITV